MALTKTPELFSHFEDLEDPRVERTRLHSLQEMIVVALCAAICGAEGWVDVERVRRQLEGTFVLPHLKMLPRS